MIDARTKSKRLRDLGSTPPQSGDVIADKYRIERVVGSGGMGIVVSARHMQLGQQVAIKLLRLNGLEPDRQLEARARFLREGQAAAGLASDHVVKIHDVGTLDSGEPFMVMELLKGDDLAKIIDRQGEAPIEVAVDYVLQACHAVAEAHSSGIVHRDLKPSNLFVSIRSDGRATVKVLDFGISKTTGLGADGFDGNLTDTRSVVGSPYYMSPEQVRDAKRVDGRTDIWSLGTILYELISSEPVFNASTLPGICAAIAADTPRSLCEGRPTFPPELDKIIAKCLEKNPDNRYQTIAELMNALEPFAPAPDSVLSSVYAVPRDVMLLSEPFEPKVPRDAPTLHLATQQSGPPTAVAQSLRGSVVKGATLVEGEAPVPTQLSPASSSGSRRRQEFATSATLVSSSSKLDLKVRSAETAEGVETPSSGRGRLVAIALFVVVVVVAVFVLSRDKTPPASPQVTTKVVTAPKAEETPVKTAEPPPAPVPVAAIPESAVAPSATAALPRPGVPRPRPVRPVPPPAQVKPQAPSDIRLER
ncbi:MAG TPA: serine/threonine-protein kinase [Polyangiaceae bacterium]|jgi:serine/threonine-protein kinase|nr:serine/threonine-protein kinase [Polyangiaceae bacterium]